MNKYYHIYASTMCPFCVKAINLLNESEHDYILTLVDRSQDFLDNLKEKYNWETIPIIVEHNRDSDGEPMLIGGYTDIMDHFLTIQDDTSDDEDPIKIVE
tara:strand:+ start:32729 stop:33028 length:300 start_codon:yes stop_codon:yes gene_type:complete